ncbi:hypothetical protein DM02DRAFT_537526 [Periconia macrospinosa]|uniref:Auxin efflux carrier n=1 Tax=Periconia macrospinosa TaxID=97972 RepID=A0A2V1DBD1_9PLEO|nr:hypothetical protein DM02DRAFT_537526 [Periconia macrospinosa]
MAIDSSELIVPFVGAIQASISVVLTIVFGVIAAQCNLLSVNAAKEVSRLCCHMFLPALLTYKIGSNLHQNTAARYVPIFIWSITYTLLSLAVGHIACRFFKFPSWVKLAVCFNNTTSLPLLLIASLKSTGILNSIIPDSDSASAALDRAESYFLINAMVSDSLTFALGPRVLRDRQHQNDPYEDYDSSSSSSDDEGEEDAMERGPDGIIDEETTLLPHLVVHRTNIITRKTYTRTQAYISTLPPSVQTPLSVLYEFVNPPLLGALAGAIIGLTPPLHNLFFNPSDDGGYFNAWFTSAIKNIGSLFATLQIIIVGVKLSQSLLKMKAGKDSGKVPAGGLAFITVVRFLIWPAISIPLIWALATKTGFLKDDPMLWFTMMLMPTGPPAMMLVALTDITGCKEGEKMAIAKMLTICYGITPLICFAVVGSLKATEAAMGR